MSVKLNNQFNNTPPAVSRLVMPNVVTVILLCMFVPTLASANIKLESRRVSTPLSILSGSFLIPADYVENMISGYRHIGQSMHFRFLADASNSTDKPSSTINKTYDNHKTTATHHRIEHRHRHQQDTASMLLQNEVADKMPVATPMPPAEELSPEVMPEMPTMPEAPVLTTDGIVPGENDQ